LVITRCAAAGVTNAAVATTAAPINANFITLSSVDDEEDMGLLIRFRQLAFRNIAQAILMAWSETLALAGRRCEANLLPSPARPGSGAFQNLVDSDVLNLDPSDGRQS
jgi:hypothetical protein